MEPGALVGAAAAAALAVVLIAVLLLARSVRARRAGLAAELARSRQDVEALGRRVAHLAEELRDTRQAAAADHEYVITSLGGDDAGEDLLEHPGTARALHLAPRRVPLGRLLEDRLVGSLTRRGAAASPRGLAAVVVHTVALGHGVRRALAPDVLDRAAAESQVARRRSRRTRRKELRDARRLLRSVKAQDVA